MGRRSVLRGRESKEIHNEIPTTRRSLEMTYRLNKRETISRLSIPLEASLNCAKRRYCLNDMPTARR
jgi:hypothetical protein